MAKGNVEFTPEGDIDKSKVPFLTSSRVGLAVLGFLGFINVYALRVNLSVGVVCMVNQTWVKASIKSNDSDSTLVSECASFTAVDPNVTESTALRDGKLLWDKTTQGLVLGAYFWGYLVSQVPAGWLATKYGGKRVYGWSMLVCSLLTFLTPIVATTNYIAVMALRIILGLASGAAFPAMHTFWGNWAPPLERSKLTAFTYAGAQVGNVVTFPLAGFLCKYGFAGGWPSIFYVLGAMSLVWFFLWMFFVSDTPAQHKRISGNERRYIEHTLRDSVRSHKKLNVPWKSIALSLPSYAIIVSNITSDWGAYTLLTNIPTYMNEVLKFDIAANGLYSALPYIVFWVIINLAGWLADFVRRRSIFTTTNTRKIFDSFGKVIPAVMLVGLGYVDCSQPALAITLLVLGVSLTGFQFSGFIVNHVDIAPAYAGILFGISNSIAAVTGFISPVVVGVITSESQTRAEWQVVFYIAAAMYGFGAIFYVIFASGELQPWAREESEEEEKMAVEMETKGGHRDGAADGMLADIKY
ncbi:sialin-like [Haliotis rufescens]|uniref:sialin-like n=1 Tax=Haliotis rufescens TaxID=6454 RepID=UPI00201F5169|nr:sialin-like [Haliotis rufescens]